MVVYQFLNNTKQSRMTKFVVFKRKDYVNTHVKKLEQESNHAYTFYNS